MKRFKLSRVPHNSASYMKECPNGGWVEHSDAAAIEAENAELRAKANGFDLLIGALAAHFPHADKPEPTVEALLDAVKEAKALRAKVAKLEEDAAKELIDAARMLEFEYTQRDGRGEFNARVQSPLMNVLAQWISADFKRAGAENYVEQEVHLTLTDRAEEVTYTVLVQRAGGKTPAQVAGELRAKVEELTQALDAEREAVRVLAEVRKQSVRFLMVSGFAFAADVAALKNAESKMYANPIARAAVEKAGKEREG